MTIFLLNPTSEGKKVFDTYRIFISHKFFLFSLFPLAAEYNKKLWNFADPFVCFYAQKKL